jgi:hypothetical protein
VNSGSKAEFPLIEPDRQDIISPDKLSLTNKKQKDVTAFGQ